MKWSGIVALTASIGACVLCSSFASAQPAPMRIIDLGPIGPDGSADGDFDNSFGINCRGEVCGSMIVNGERHAFLWLPQPNYGLAANTLHDLTALAGLPGYSVANDLNNNGVIVGEYVDGNGDMRC